MASQTVECYFLNPNQDVPNNKLPVLHYRNVLPKPLDEDSVTNFLTANKWEKRGTWGHIGIRHFHPNSHECYGIFRGRSRLLLGRISPDGKNHVEVEVNAGDVIVLPAGTAHSSLESSPDYRYIGVYPQKSPKWINETGKKAAAAVRHMVDSTALPESDPVYGANGPLVYLWGVGFSTKPGVQAKL